MKLALFFLMSFSLLIHLLAKIYSFLMKKPDFTQFELNASTDQLIDNIIDEIDIALSLNQTEVIYKFNPMDPPIDGEVVAMVTVRVNKMKSCILLFTHEDNHDVKITIKEIQ